MSVLVLTACGSDGSSDPSESEAAASTPAGVTESDGATEPESAANGGFTSDLREQVFAPVVELVAVTEPGGGLGSAIGNAPGADFATVVAGLRQAMQEEGWAIVSERETDMAGNPAVQISFDAGGIAGLATVIDQGDNIRVVYGSNQP